MVFLVFHHDPAANSNVSSLTGLEEKPVEAEYLQQSNAYDPLVDEAEDPKFEKRTIPKIDWRVLPLFGIIYTVAYVDRANTSVARISEIDEDLGLDIGDRASIALLVFFVGYIIFEIPSNILIKNVGAANWIAAITVAWGAVTIGQGFIHDWISLCILRYFLGAFEAVASYLIVAFIFVTS